MPNGHCAELQIHLLSHSTSALEGVVWSTPRSSGRFSLLKPTVQEAGWASGLVWMGLENLAPTRVRTPVGNFLIPIANYSGAERE